MKVRLDGYYLNVIINGIYTHRECCNDVSSFLLRLVNESEKMKSNRKKSFVFSRMKSRLFALVCLNGEMNRYEPKRK